MASLENYTPSPCLLGAMDRLWFQKVVLISEPALSSPPKPPIPNHTPPASSPKSHSSSHTNCSDDDDVVAQDASHGAHPSFPSTPSSSPKSDSKQEDDKKESTRASVSKKKMRGTGGSIRRRTRTRIRLEKTRSSKSSAELEEEEVKGFMDLGFVFDKERLTPKMRSMIPGLQRVEGQDEEGERRRPYLSEAWMMERQEESPIVMAGMPMVNAAANDMKKHLKIWAKTVAVSAVQHV